ncbi:hypothetical protein QWJ34_07230 [Saccharibacillus sp. CPCC 101409]|nr:hypothetical protein [Saccharibacillus sp. CPCC 101409]MDO3409552.1 hypothetical protein [Saccharibacillus sp. CPCC 101409]
MESNQTVPQFSDILEEVNFILYGSKAGKEQDEHAPRQEEPLKLTLG